MEADDERPSLTLGIDYGHYSAHRVLGVGPFGTVYDAVRKTDGTRVALKVIHPHLARAHDVVPRFGADLIAAMTLEHPHIAPLRDRGMRAGVPYLATDVLQGQNLRDTLTATRTLSLGRIADTMIPVLAALAAAHARGVAHRDLKPENVFLVAADDGVRTPMLLDFGVAALREYASASVARALQASAPQYLSPEQARREVADARADLWAVGVMLYEAATGRLPFNGGDIDETLEAIQYAAFAPPSHLVRALPESFDTLVRRVLTRAPSDRLTDPMEVARALVPFARQAGRDAWVAYFGQRVPSSRWPASSGGALATSIPSLPPPPMPKSTSEQDARRYLLGVESFARLAPAELDTLLSFVRWRVLDPDEVLYREGTPGSTMGFLAEGRLLVCLDVDGTRRELTHLHAGTFVGEMACLDPSPRSATVVAETLCVVGEFSRDGLQTLQTAAPRAAAALVGVVLRGVVQRIREVEARIDEALEAAETLTPEPVSQTVTAETTGLQRLLDWLRGR